MSRLLKAAVILSLVGGGIILFAQGSKSVPVSALQEETPPPPVASQGSVASAAGVVQPAQTGETEKPRDARDELTSCFPEWASRIYSASSAPRSNEELFQALGRELTETGRTSEWSNTQIILPNGERKRISLTREFDEAGKSWQRLRLFSVDAENLPIPLSLSKDQARNPSRETIASLLREGREEYSEESLTIRYSGGAEASVEVENGAFRRFTLAAEARRFSCGVGKVPGALHCRCLTR